jgi:hypothetical protein
MTALIVLMCVLWFATLATIVYINYDVMKEKNNASKKR